jgi:hypothetical protein
MIPMKIRHVLDCLDKPRARRFAITATATALLHFLTSTATAAIIAFGSLTDPVGDAVGGKADITSASISIDDSGNITFTTLFSSGSFVSDTSLGFLFDLDSNGATGAPSPTLPGFGVDALLLTDLGSPGTGIVALWNGSTFTGSPVTLVHTPTMDSYTATLPLSLFGAPTSPISFHVSSSSTDVETIAFRDMTSVGIITSTGTTPPPTASVPDGGSSALLFSAALGLMAGSRFRQRKVSQAKFIAG